MTKRKAPTPESFNSGDMKRDWNGRARACAREYILTGFADRPDDFAESGRQAAASLRAFCDAGSIVLDLGCGIGRVARELAPHVREIHAVDVSEEMIAQARAYVGPDARIRFHVNDGHSLDALGGGSVDFAFSLLTMHHVTREAFAGYLYELHRVLRPRGRFLFSVVSRDRSRRYDVDEARDTFTGRAYSDEDLAALLATRFEEERRWFTESGDGEWRVTYVNLVVRRHEDA